MPERFNFRLKTGRSHWEKGSDYYIQWVIKLYYPSKLTQKLCQVCSIVRGQALSWINKIPLVSFQWCFYKIALCNFLRVSQQAMVVIVSPHGRKFTKKKNFYFGSILSLLVTMCASFPTVSILSQFLCLNFTWLLLNYFIHLTTTEWFSTFCPCTSESCWWTFTGFVFLTLRKWITDLILQLQDFQLSLPL